VQKRGPSHSCCIGRRPILTALASWFDRTDAALIYASEALAFTSLHGSYHVRVQAPAASDAENTDAVDEPAAEEAEEPAEEEEEEKKITVGPTLLFHS
jgi:hypothetical protein